MHDAVENGVVERLLAQAVAGHEHLARAGQQLTHGHGAVGLLLGLTLFGVLVWFLVDRDLMSLTGSAIVWVGLLVVGVLLGVGLSWSLLRAKATGQLEVS